LKQWAPPDFSATLPSIEHTIWRHVVVQQPVGLVGAQVVRMGQDVLVPADAPQPADEL
jgi:hypothetical protein